MTASRIPITNTRLRCAVIVTVSLCLVFLGMRAPNISRAHSPKPRPRAVIETAVKISQMAGTRVNVDVEACKIALVLNISTPFRSTFRQEIRKISFIPIEHHTARAPPVIPA
jgi:hypothetical protein